MKFLAALFALGWLVVAVAPAHGEDKVALRLVQTIPMPGVVGRLDHMAVDLEKQRLFLAAVANGTLEVLDLGAGKVINSLTGFKDTQDALFLGGHFNKLYVSSLDGTLLDIPRCRTFRLVQALKLRTGPQPSSLRPPRPDLIYFGLRRPERGIRCL